MPYLVGLCDFGQPCNRYVFTLEKKRADAFRNKMGIAIMIARQAIQNYIKGVMS